MKKRTPLPTVASESWEVQREKKVKEFLDGADWTYVVRQWRGHLERFNVQLDPLFRTVTVIDPGCGDDREPALSWWPVDAIDKMRERINRHFVSWPGTNGPLHYYDQISKGEYVTLKHLWRLRDDPEGIAAVLIAGSFFPRMDASRSYYSDDFWPPRYCARELREMAYKCWREKSEHWGWHFACTQVLADKSEDWYFKIDSLHALVRYLAEEHASLLLTHVPVVIEYASRREPELISVAAK